MNRGRHYKPYHRPINTESHIPGAPRLKGFKINDIEGLEHVLGKMEEILDNIVGKGNAIRYKDIPQTVMGDYEMLGAKAGDTLAEMPEDKVKKYYERLTAINGRISHEAPMSEYDVEAEQEDIEELT